MNEEATSKTGTTPEEPPAAPATPVRHAEQPAGLYSDNGAAGVEAPGHQRDEGAEAGQGLPDGPPADAPYWQPALFTDAQEEARAAEQGEGGGPSRMLAFVTLWAGATSLHEAWVVLTSAASHAVALRSLGFQGYLWLGLGLILFGVEALLGGRRRVRASVLVLLAALMTIAGVVCLILSGEPGRRI